MSGLQTATLHSKASSKVNLLNDDTLPMEFCDLILQTNRVRCALYMEILDVLNEESVSGAPSGRASLLGK